MRGADAGRPGADRLPAGEPARPHPELGVPPDRRGGPRATCAQALRGARAPGRGGARAHPRRARHARQGGPRRRRRTPGVRARHAARPRPLRRVGRGDERPHARCGAQPRQAPELRRDPRPRLARRGGRRRPCRAPAAPVRHDDPRHGVRPPPGLGRQAPAVLHPRHRDVDGRPRGSRHHLLALHARPRRRRLRHPRAPGDGDPQRDRPRRPAAGRRPRRAARALRGPRRATRPARRPARLREGLSARARRACAGDPPGWGGCASSSPARAPTRRS